MTDARGFLALDAARPFCVQRRLGRQATSAAAKHKDLFLMFMAAPPRDVQPVLDYEAEEAGILSATEGLPLALTGEESGCLAFLRNRLSAEGQTGQTAAAPVPRQPSQPGTRLCIGAGLSPERWRVRSLLRWCRRDRLQAFKIKVGHPDFDRDLTRLKLLAKTVRPGALVMIDANEAWGAKEAAVKLEAIRRARMRPD